MHSEYLGSAAVSNRKLSAGGIMNLQSSVV